MTNTRKKQLKNDHQESKITFAPSQKPLIQKNEFLFSPCFSFSNEKMHQNCKQNKSPADNFLLKRNSLDLEQKIFPDNHGFADEFRSFDKDFETNKTKILGYIGKLCDLQKSIIMNNIRNINSLKYIFHSNGQMFRKEYQNSQSNAKMISKNKLKKFNPNVIPIQGPDRAGRIEQTLPKSAGPPKRRSRSDEFESLSIDDDCDCNGVLQILKMLFEMSPESPRLEDRKAELKRLLVDFVGIGPDSKPLFSRKLKKFLIYFFSQNSQSKDFRILTKIEKLLFFVILIKKRYIEKPFSCFCFEKVKPLELVDTGHNLIDAIKWSLDKMLTDICHNDLGFPTTEKNELEKLYSEFYDYQLVIKIMKPEMSRPEKNLEKEKSQINELRYIINKIHSMYFSDKIFQKENYLILIRRAFKHYYQFRIKEDFSKLIREFRKCSNKPDFGGSFLDFLLNFIWNLEISIPFNKQEIVRAMKLISDTSAFNLYVFNS